MRRLTMLIVVGVFVAACGGSTGGAAADGTEETAADAAAPAPTAAAADATPDGTASELVPFGVVETVGGDTVDGEDYAGGNLALWFWAPW